MRKRRIRYLVTSLGGTRRTRSARAGIGRRTGEATRLFPGKPTRKAARMVCIVCAVFLFVRAYPGLDGVSDAHPSPDSTASSLFLDFEDSIAGYWRYCKPEGLWPDPLVVRVVSNRDENNSSGRVLLCELPEDSSKAGVSFLFDENNIAPIPLTRDTRIAWNWKVSRVEDMNGLWLRIAGRDKRNGDTQRVAFVNWVENLHDALVYYDPPLVWCYHEAMPFEYFDDRFGPISDGDIEIDLISLILQGPGVEAWIDNIWLGEGPPPRDIDVSRMGEGAAIYVPSSLRSFSYGFIDGDLIPDRVDVYPNRAEILLNPEVTEAEEPMERDVEFARPPAATAPDVRRIAFRPTRGSGAVALADLDGDARADLLFGFDDKLGNLCYLNRWTRHQLMPIASSLHQTGQHSYGAAAADIDMDGDLDVLMINPFCRHRRFGGLRLLKNESDGQFVDWTDDSGVYSGGVFGATFGDVNDDGFPDLFVGYQSCNRTDGRPGYYGPALYINDGTGRFIDRTDGLPLSYTLRVSGAVFADFDNNGSLDLYAAVYEDLDKSRPARNRLLLNDGTGVFRDVTDQSGAGCLPGGGSALAEDFDNDGDVDLYVIRSESPNMYLRNVGGAVFEDFTVYSSFLFKEGAIGGVAADVDSDGDVDVALMCRDQGARRLLKNNMGGVGNHLDVALRGIRNNRSGLGTKIRVYETGHIGDPSHLVGFREVTGGKGFRQWGPLIAHFGLGPREIVDVEVAFPPVDGEPSLVVNRLGVSAGQTIEMWEYRNLWERIRHNRLLAAVTDWIVSLAYTMPLGLLFIVVIGSVLVTGMRVRTRVGPVRLGAGDVAFGVVTIAAVGVGLVRSWPFAAGVAVAGAVIVLFYRWVAVIVLRLLPRKTRERLEDEVLADIHGVTHLEGAFHFFHDIQHMSARELTKHVDQAAGRLRSLVLKMRVLTPNNSTCRLLREEIAYLKFLTATGPDGDVPTRRAADASDSRDATPRSLDANARWRKNIQEVRDRIRTHLAQYKVDLRGRMSIDPLAAWRGVLDEVSTDLAAAGARITADMQGVDPGVRVHLRPQEFDFIFKNLIYNSLDATRDSDVKQVHVSFERKGSQLVARWADTGRGVPAGFEKRLGVEPVRSSTNGSGQGLYRSHVILSNRDGRIRWEEPAADEGAVFVVKLLITGFDARASGKPV